MDVFYTYTYSTAGWLAMQAVPLVVIPKLIISMLSSEAHASTDLEIYFSRSLGFALLLIALIVLFFTGTIPISSSVTEPVVSLQDHDDDAKAPYAVPILRITTLYHFVGLVYCYVRWSSWRHGGQTGYLLGALGYGFLACMGLWCVVFGTERGRISKRTGADKRMAGFPFTNVNKYDKRKDRKVR